MRQMISQGIPVSISSDDPGFFGYDGVTLDFVYAFMAWDLNLAEIKKMQIDSIKHSTLNV